MTTATRTDALAEKLAAEPAPTAGTVAVRQPDRVQALLDGMRAEFERCLPDILPVDMFMRLALTGFKKTPELALCSRTSLLGALLECARLGLAPCTEEASLVPFKNQVTLIIGYQGHVQLMYRSGMVERVEAEFVYAADEWEYSLGDGGRFWHKPNILAEDRGAILFAYSYAKLAGDARTKVVITTRQQALALQREYGKDKYGKPNPQKPWYSHFEEMWQKTPIRRVQRFAPKSAELRRAAAMDGATFDEAGNVETVEGEVLETQDTRTLLMTRVIELFTDCEIEDDASRAAYVKDAISRDVSGFLDLTEAELATLAEALERYKAQMQPADAS